MGDLLSHVHIGSALNQRFNLKKFRESALSEEMMLRAQFLQQFPCHRIDVEAVDQSVVVKVGR